jgi:hypothetical protein
LLKDEEQKMADEKENIQRQIVLPLSKALEISFKSLRIRFWRSIITTGGVILGIAFLMSIFTTNLVNKGLIEKGSIEISTILREEEEESSAQQIWLVTLSLLVCVVGITNAMLMSVTERYREIGTMKCLGALDTFIWKLFLLESLLRYGGQVIPTFPKLQFMGYALAALVIGVVISVIGAFFPASQAAKMVPAEAMRSEM